MKNIKFRAWDKSINEMLTQPLDGISAASRLLGFTVFSQCEVMQYTGLKDKNGKEIYEGDIISFTKTRRQGFQDEGEACIGPVKFGEFNPDNSTLSQYIGFHINGRSIQYILNYDDAKVISNIHENPELLTVA